MNHPRIPNYTVLQQLGEGGMGAVFLARDERLGRKVAIKTLHGGGRDDPSTRLRFQQEAKAASGLNHPNIVTVYDIGAEGDVDFIAMEYVDGESLAAQVGRGEHGVKLALRIGLSVASALAAAHAAGIVHRDLKPANVMLSQGGLVKLVDFGLAKYCLLTPSADDAATRQLTPNTTVGTLLGTPAYMAPEQVEGRAVDARTDVFALGVLLYELLSGRRPFQGSSQAALLSSILRDEPESLQHQCRDCPRPLARLVLHCLRKSPADRPQDAGVALAALQQIDKAWRARATPLGKLLRPHVLWPVALVVLGAMAWAGQQGWQARKDLARLAAGIAQMAQMLEVDHRVEAYGVLRGLEQQFPKHPELAQWWNELSIPGDLITEPPGAKLWLNAYDRPGSPWIDMGESDQRGSLLPFDQVRWRVEKPGYRTLELASRGDLPRILLIADDATAPSDMVHVPGGRVGFNAFPASDLEDFWLDRTEVTNAAFQRFVDAGGYADPQWWQEAVIIDGRALTFDESRSLFRDSTGRAGPSEWELGQHRKGEQQLPVTGVSWYEAAAYARFVGKSLPTAHHWLRAADYGAFANILGLANFDGEGPAMVASRGALTSFGNHDLAGNVAEWVQNGAASRRLILGGHWGSSPYMFNHFDNVDALARNRQIGFRCARLDTPPNAELVIAPSPAPIASNPPISDDVFAAYARLFRYEPAGSAAELESDQLGEYGRVETWRIPAETGGNTFRLKLYLPTDAKPPYQAVLFGPPSSAFLVANLDQTRTRDFGFLVRSGRAVAFPSYAGTHERRLPPDAGPQAWRTLRIGWVKDANRVVDFLVARPDIDSNRIGYYGLSLGANNGFHTLAMEPRLQAAVMVSGGIGRPDTPPEFDVVNFAPRVRQPVLMVGGRYDASYPLESNQLRLLDLLGSAPQDKAHYVFDGGHMPPRMQEVMGVTLDWFDRQLGPVRRQPTP
ncbi:MAG: bifunctional serine/threonine-protein kinase/formylglycine-generating enzyme family protein [Pseudomarimonas sp.]